MNWFDSSVLQFLNSFAHRSYALDASLVYVMNDNFIKGGLCMALYAWAWSAGGTKWKQACLLYGFVLSMVALVLARVLALVLPFSVRPLLNPSVHFHLPYTMDASVLEGWSSFPSDHAVLFSCLTVVLYRVDRPLGILAAIHTLCVVVLPRLYTGVHYPTDVIAGAMIGGVVAHLLMRDDLIALLTVPVVRWKDAHPGPLHAILFLAAFEVGELFSTVRVIAHPLSQPLKMALLRLGG